MNFKRRFKIIDKYGITYYTHAYSYIQARRFVNFRNKRRQNLMKPTFNIFYET